jgi:hypothetical protein
MLHHDMRSPYPLASHIYGVRCITRFLFPPCSCTSTFGNESTEDPTAGRDPKPVFKERPVRLTCSEQHLHYHTSTTHKEVQVGHPTLGAQDYSLITSVSSMCTTTITTSIFECGHRVSQETRNGCADPGGPSCDPQTIPMGSSRKKGKCDRCR